MTLRKSDWFVGSNSNSFFDWGGWRWSIRREGREYFVARNGVQQTTGDVLTSLKDAKEWVEINSGYIGSLCDSVEG